MKVHIRPYINHMRLSWQVIDRLRFLWEWKLTDDDTRDEFETKLADSRIGEWLDSLGDRYNNWKESRKVNVKLDNYDTWSMDSTLAYIIVPMLKQLRYTKNGAPIVDDDDVPEILRSYNDPEYTPGNTNGDIDRYFFRRWNWVMDEMIWTFEMINDDYVYETFETTEEHIAMGRIVDERIDNGLRLFGKYYRSLWD